MPQLGFKARLKILFNEGAKIPELSVLARMFTVFISLIYLKKSYYSIKIGCNFRVTNRGVIY
jgi:hypothetical protein